jgi:Anti-sigma factor NepR
MAANGKKNLFPSEGSLRNHLPSAAFPVRIAIRGRERVSLRRRMIEQSPMRRSRSKSPSLDEARLRQQAIGVKLRQMFDEVVNEPVPDDFLNILRRADDTRAGVKK